MTIPKQEKYIENQEKALADKGVTCDEYDCTEMNHLYMCRNRECIHEDLILTRRLRLRLEKAPGENTLIDRTDRCLKMEPLTTVADLERYLLKMVAKQWYDFDRSTFNFVKKLKEPGVSLTFTHQNDFDENGLLYWIGTNGKTSYEWVNPGQYGLVVVTSSEGRSLPYGKLEDILSRDSAALNCHK
uniref:E3 ubiquitin-protein ligase n=1 Tax=Biomphalaria glabrata TaxID=6526 RepID=A0A2C9L685_BIOGL